MAEQSSHRPGLASALLRPGLGGFVAPGPAAPVRLARTLSCAGPGPSRAPRGPGPAARGRPGRVSRGGAGSQPSVGARPLRAVKLGLGRVPRGRGWRPSGRSLEVESKIRRAGPPASPAPRMGSKIASVRQAACANTDTHQVRKRVSSRKNTADAPAKWGGPRATVAHASSSAATLARQGPAALAGAAWCRVALLLRPPRS